ncbi:hypothetical protein NMG60_11004125 [Bertholletia excelsa]
MSHITNPTSSTITTNRVNGNQACAACKYRRRKCASDCLLSPYFPHNRHHQFRNAHRLFGVSNITKIIQHLSPSQKDAAMQTIIFESNVHAADPVGGCYRIIRDLSRQIEFARAELDLVLQQLALCRAVTATTATPAPQLPPPDDGSPATEFDVFEPLVGHDPTNYNQFQQPNEEYFLQGNNHAVPLQGGGGDASSWAAHDDVVAASGEAEESCLHGKEIFIGECEDFKPAIIDPGGERLVLKFDHKEETVQQRFAF